MSSTRNFLLEFSLFLSNYNILLKRLTLYIVMISNGTQKYVRAMGFRVGNAGPSYRTYIHHIIISVGNVHSMGVASQLDLELQMRGRHGGTLILRKRRDTPDQGLGQARALPRVALGRGSGARGVELSLVPHSRSRKPRHGVRRLAARSSLHGHISLINR